MNLLKLTFLGFLFQLSLASYAQVAVNLSVGGNMSKINAINVNGFDIETTYKPGFQAGATFDIPLSERVLFYPGVMFANKGYKNTSAAGKTTLSANFLEIPVNVLYKFNLGSGNLLVGAGPYVTYGLGGKWKFSKGNASDTVIYITSGPLEFVDDYSRRSSASNSIPYGRKLDFGGNGILGIEKKRLKILLEGQVGLLNLEPFEAGVRPVHASQQTLGLKLHFVYKLLTIN